MSAFYKNSLEHFLSENTHNIVGKLTMEAGNRGFYVQKHTQTLSWDKEITILKNVINNLKVNRIVNGVLLEYVIPRREKRIDTVLILDDIIYVIEFKINAKNYLKSDINQVEDYALDIRDFHRESNKKIIIPILVATESKQPNNIPHDNGQYVKPLIYANKENLSEVIEHTHNIYSSQTDIINYKKWNASEYNPTPTIIEAAMHLYAGKNVKEISRTQAGHYNLTKTTESVIKAIKEAQRTGEKLICFITGVPGAGKTLAGLNIVHNQQLHSEGDLGVFLTGNGPLVEVLREALARDIYNREDIRIGEARRRVSTFIQNVHKFLDEYFYDKKKVPVDKVVLFDEAQRAWDAEQSKRKFKRDFSEAEMILDIMDRHDDWSVIVCLVGGGQEINSGEAGLQEWGTTLKNKYSDWNVLISPELKEGHHSTGGSTLFKNAPSNLNIIEDENLHLRVSIRSFKAEKLSEWVAEVLNRNSYKAKFIYQEYLGEYPIKITRNLSKAKDWLNSQSRGNRRSGLVASSGARRLIPYALDVTQQINVAKWFLEDDTDIRSSLFHELPATEFAVQGLELDYTCLCWGGDLRSKKNDWEYKNFRGTKWQNVNKEGTQKYILNKYRVLMTRAREGMVIWVPQGSDKDITRKASIYDETYQYLINCGIEEI